MNAIQIKEMALKKGVKGIGSHRATILEKIINDGHLNCYSQLSKKYHKNIFLKNLLDDLGFNLKFIDHKYLKYQKWIIVK